ncbi:unnamed protein product [Dicrocoelium dendriticum]|nr:unnamed protein product [Dicrocoelium dendriticum]
MFPHSAIVYSDLSPTSGYLYLFLINNITVTLALYGLLLFYFAARDQLRPFKPILKFATIKAIIFFSFWQDVLFSLLEWSHLLGGNDHYPSGMASTGLKNILICIELVVASVTLRYAFPYSVYVFHHPPRLVLDLQLDDDNCPNRPTSGTGPKHPVQKSSSNLQTLRADLLYGTAAFADRSAEPLPWDVLASQDSAGDVDRDVVHFSGNSTVLPSISAGIRTTMDPTDIFVDAVHNFHPNYRHYTQAKLDDSL